ncbi:MAG TPA: glycosyl hydrolase [Thermoanaerobaculia bacterium]|nr:glycosyl hydrolase [Thermoanaerobaculia bacterium]
MSLRNSLFLCFAAGLVCTAAAAAAAPPEPVELDESTFGGIQARAIGPAVTGGRVAAIDAVPDSPTTIYVGAASGGVWKSIDGGISWKPVFDEHTQSIGAIAIDPKSPQTVWVGTGESWTRNSVSVGDGLYRTTNGGDSWERIGLEKSERIARVAVHPTDGNVVWACATGHLWDANEERGVYKTADGGKSWKKVLYVDADTGCSDLAVDPQDPRILYAGMWQFRRTPAAFRSGGKGSGLFKSTDGGETWRQLKQGLPAGEKGRVAVAIAPSRPSVVYALVEAKETALYRSDDVGLSWSRVNTSFNIQIRPFYFARLAVDPSDFNYVYKPGLTLSISTDGGKTFTSPFSGGNFGAGVHSDHHAIWINPKNPQELLLGTDGGLYVSGDRGHHWRLAKALPIAQFYHVSYDMDWPYNVYGGLQDNGSWRGPSRAIGEIENRDWDNIGNGDGFYAFRDLAEKDVVYVEYQGGNVSRNRLSTGESKDIKPLPAAGDPDYRFNWNTPIHLSPSTPGTLYIGAQFLFRSRDRGESWERISPDLTTNDPKQQAQLQSGGLTIDNSSAENHTTIYSIAESTKNPQVIWVGTDDGNLQVTRDGGKSWTNVAGNVPGLPKGTWVSCVEAGRYDEATAFATFDGHQTGDMKTYVYKTADGGRSWKALQTPAIEGYAHVIRQDLVDPDLLFVGTESGLFLSVDGGGRWARFTGNFPRVAVRDLAIHPRESDLLIATHGRGMYILDDITPLRQLTQKVLDSEVTLLPGRPSVMVIPASKQEFSGDDEFAGFNPEEAAAITYYQKKRHIFGDLKIEVYDEQGKLVSTVAGSKRKGVNRVQWPMRLKAPKFAEANAIIEQPFSFIGPRVLPGTYKIKLIKGAESYAGEVQLVPDPRSEHSAADRAAQHETVMKLYEMLGRLAYLADSSAGARDQASRRAADLKPGDRLRQKLDSLAGKLDAFHKTTVATSEAGWLSGEVQLREKLGTLYGAVNGYEGRPTRSQLDQVVVLQGELDRAGARFAAILGKDLAAVNRSLAARKLAPIKVPDQAEWEKKQADS